MAIHEEPNVCASPFSAQEFSERQRRVQDRARRSGFDALLIADPANLFYLTGYDAWSFYTPQVLHLPVDGTPTLLLREMDAHGAWRSAVGISPEAILGYPDIYVQQADSHPGDWMAQQLRERGHGSAQRVGYEGEAHFFTVRTYRAFAAALPEWTFDDCHDLVNWVRLIKSPSEISLMRTAGRVCGSAMRAALAGLVPGRPQNEVAADILAAQVRGVDGAEGDFPAIVPLLPTGATADTPHVTWTTAPIPSDEPISIELAGAHRRYHAPLARTAFLGRPPRDLARLAGATVDGLTAALEAVRPGATGHAIAEAFTRVIEAAGYSKASRLGYPIGIGYPPDWGERTVSIRAGDDVELAENMTFHVIAGMWITGLGFEVSESIRVTESGVELLVDCPRELIVLGSRRNL